MLATLGAFLLAVSVGVFRWTLRRGLYRRYPYEQFVLVGASMLFGLASVLRTPGIVSGALFVVELLAFLMLVFYMGVGARFRRSQVSLEVGDRFPSFELPDSQGGTFDSDSLQGTTALYLFYRGHW